MIDQALPSQAFRAALPPPRPAIAKRLLLPLLLLPLSACHEGLLDPQGPVGAAERTILLNSLGIMLAIVIPTIIATLAIAWWFRAGNTRAGYRPDWEYSGRIEMVVWSIPAMVVLLLGGIGWIGSHDLDPPKPLASSVKPIEVDVVALDWKWLFIYPEQGVASVNRLVIPAGTPISFRITSAGVMNSFFVPQLGSQIYAMAGMTARLNLMADNPGTYPGLSAQFSGDGFSDMRFNVDAMKPADFQAWATQARGQGPVLDDPAYQSLVQPTKAVSPYSYRAVAPGLFEKITMLQAPSTPMPDSGRPNAATSPRTDMKQGG